MQEQFSHFLNKLQAYLPTIYANSAIIVAIILFFMFWALKSQLKRQNRRFLRELKQELHKQSQKMNQASSSSEQIKASLIEQKIMIYQEFVNLRANHQVELQNAGENGLSAKRYYYYFTAFRDLVINNRFYVSQESEFVFNQLMQDNAASLLKIKQLEHDFAELANEAPADRYALEQLIEQESSVLDTFQQESKAEMERFLEIIDADVLKLRSEINL